MEQKNKQSKFESNAKVVTFISVFSAVIGFGMSHIPWIGIVAWGWGVIAILTGLVAYFMRRKIDWKNHWIYFSFVLSILCIYFSYSNFKEHSLLHTLLAGSTKDKVELLVNLQDKKNEKEVSVNQEEVQEISDTVIAESEDDEESIEDYNKPNEVGTQAIDELYYCLVDRLRVRSSPDLKGGIVGYLAFGTQLHFEGEKTKKQEIMEIAGKERNDFWYKVKEIRGNVQAGWVYGGALIRATEDSFLDESNRTVKIFTFIEQDTVQSIVGRNMEQLLYSGVATYKISDENKLVLDGPFAFRGLSTSDYYGYPGGGDSQRISGEFKNGELNGGWLQRKSNFESFTDLEITFENGICKSYKMIHNEEGDVEESMSNNPANCTWEYIYSLLKYTK